MINWIKLRSLASLVQAHAAVGLVYDHITAKFQNKSSSEWVFWRICLYLYIKALLLSDDKYFQNSISFLFSCTVKTDQIMGNFHREFNIERKNDDDAFMRKKKERQ